VWKVDLAKAYRQAPVHPDHRCHATFAAREGGTGETFYFAHRALPFGGASSPFQFSRISHALAYVATALFDIPLLFYLDDFFGIGPAGLPDDLHDSLADLMFETF